MVPPAKIFGLQQLVCESLRVESRYRNAVGETGASCLLAAVYDVE